MAPIPGETKVWQYVSLMKRIYLIDCPGVVPPSSTDTPTDLILRGVVRVEKVEHPEQYIAALLGRVKKQHMEKTYELRGWTNSTELLELLARKSGRLLRGGEPDLDGVAKMVLNDFMRGKIPWFTPAPSANDDNDGIQGRNGRLGEMPKKRSQDHIDDGSSEDGAAENKYRSTGGASDHEDEEFKGFGSDPEPVLQTGNPESPAECHDDENKDYSGGERDIQEVEETSHDRLSISSAARDGAVSQHSSKQSTKRRKKA